ncbi:MAG: 4Fe-4S dicluster domain-containing protein [Deltaproteobacteria bacterium]|nr:4Fe-4S dicluster domain-containing protein [Deltaproteobacteria bacterium]
MGSSSRKSGHALRPVESAPSYGDISEDPIAALRRLSVFRDLTDAEINRLAAFVEVTRLPQDRIVPRGGDEGEAPAYLFLLKGKVAFGEFNPGTVPGPPNPKRRATPTMQVAHRIVALFDTQDFFTNEHVSHARSEDGVKREMALFTCVHCVFLKIPAATMQEVLRDLPEVQSAVDIIAQESYYRQEFLKLEGRADLFDFYVREGFEYAKAIKVIQTDKCIDCDECVRACEDRHGVARIERFGPRRGLLQFTLNCRTCEDARCIDVCSFDAIGYDDDSEVIVYDNCVGCTKCAKSCPHEAIRMVDIVEAAGSVAPDSGAARAGAAAGAASGAPDLVQLARGKVGTRVAKGEEKAPRKKAKRIANKCDHCFGYADMACISACPTGAIIQIDPRALFRRDGGLIEHADQYFDPSPFEYGYSDTTKTQGVRAMHALFVVTALGVAACIFEFVVRKTDPSLSLFHALTGRASATTTELVYSAVSGMGRWMGYIGAIMMTISALYTMRLHVPGLRRVGSAKTWFDFHVVFGLAGPILSLLHTNLNIFDPNKWLHAALWWSIASIVFSGLVGRFLYTLIPRLETATRREQKRLDDGIQQVADQWASMTVSANVLSQFLKAQEKTQDRRSQGAAAAASSESALRFMISMARSALQRIQATLALRFRTMKSMQNAKLRTATLRLMGQRAVIEGRMQFYGVAKGLLAKWRTIHIGLSIVMFILLIAHVALSVYAVGW